MKTLVVDHNFSMSKGFRLQGKNFHLTYKTWLVMEDLLNFLEQTLGSLKHYSLVHERGAAQELTGGANPIEFLDPVEKEKDTALATLGYEHTHVLVCCQDKVDKRSPRCLDFSGIHPNIKVLRSKLQIQNVWKYHEKDPVKLLRSDASPIVTVDYYDNIVNAPSLVEAIKAADVEVKTVSDVRSLRADRSCLPRIIPLSNAGTWTVHAPASFRALFILGPTGIGKTRFAVAQFDSPLLVSHLEDLKNFRAGVHDGIVFDDMVFNHLNPTEMIHLLDWDMDRSIRVLYGTVMIPAQTRKIFTSNIPFAAVTPPMDPAQYAAILRRVTMMEVGSAMYVTENVLERPPSPDLCSIPETESLPRQPSDLVLPDWLTTGMSQEVMSPFWTSLEL